MSLALSHYSLVYPQLAEMGDLQGIQKLVERNKDDPEAALQPVDVNILDDIDCTPLIWSARISDIDTMKYLVSKGANIEHAGFGGMTALHHVTNNMHELSTIALVEAGANVNATDDAGNTPLIYIAARGLLSGTNFLLEKGADINHVNNAGSTAFHKACNTGQLQVPIRFVEAGASINLQDAHGNTPLHLASKGAHKILLKFLLELPAEKRPDLTIKNKQGKTAKELAWDPLSEAIFP
jgi:ankyrin repeat protein